MDHSFSSGGQDANGGVGAGEQFPHPTPLTSPTSPSHSFLGPTQQSYLKSGRSKRRWFPLLLSAVLILLCSVLVSEFSNIFNVLFLSPNLHSSLDRFNSTLHAEVYPQGESGAITEVNGRSSSAFIPQKMDFQSTEVIRRMHTISVQEPPLLTVPEALRAYYNISHPFLNVAILTAPRKNSIHLLHTIDSFIIGFMAWANDNNLTDYPKNWMPFLITMLERDTWPSEHRSLQGVKELYQEYIKLGHINILQLGALDHKHHRKWDKTKGLDTNESHARRFSHVLDFLISVEREGSEAGKYVLLIEDDFPLCLDAMEKLLNRIAEAERLERERGSTPCGLFIGTGGSGFVLRRDSGLQALITYMKSLDETTILENPHDVIMQDFMLWDSGECKDRWYMSDSLYIYHTGWMHSTRGVLYDRSAWQCGWMNPLSPDVPSSNVLLTHKSWVEYLTL